MLQFPSQAGGLQGSSCALVCLEPAGPGFRFLRECSPPPRCAWAVPPAIHRLYCCHFRGHVSPFFKAAMNLLWALKPSVHFPKGWVQQGERELAEGRPCLCDISA